MTDRMKIMTLTSRPSRQLTLDAEPARDYYESLFARLEQAESSDKLARVVGVTSSACGEGVSTVATNLALVAADHADRRVLLVDANLDRPSLHRRFAAHKSPGLVTVLAEKAEPADAIQNLPAAGLCLLSTGVEVLPTRRWPSAPRVIELIDSLRLRFDWIVLDLPPAHTLSPTLSLARLVDSVVVVIERERIGLDQASKTIECLKSSGANVAGVVLNKCRRSTPDIVRRAPAPSPR